MSSPLEAGLRVSLAAIAINAVLATVKLVAGLLGNSYALIADAIESFADIGSSTLVWGGLTISARPPDQNHPYGHGKAEALAALVVALMLFGAGVGIAVQAMREIVTPHHVPATFTLFVLVAVVVIKETMYRMASAIGGRLGSTAVSADAWHHRSDAITSLIAGVGIAIAVCGGPGFAPADDWAALAASGVIFYNGGRFVRRAVDELMDIRPAEEVLTSAERVARGVQGIYAVEKVLARKMGTTYLVDMHVEVDASMSVRDAHALAHRVKDAIRDSNLNIADVLIHVEPNSQGTSPPCEPRREHHSSPTMHPRSTA
ncbi:MAG: cation diffusion facilitator family transporter [Planctomycetota bacterium]|jgi:cation diffusion facilitator family transporter